MPRGVYDRSKRVPQPGADSPKESAPPAPGVAPSCARCACYLAPDPPDYIGYCYALPSVHAKRAEDRCFVYFRPREGEA